MFQSFTQKKMETKEFTLVYCLEYDRYSLIIFTALSWIPHKHFDEREYVSRNEENYNKCISIIFSTKLFVFCVEKSLAIAVLRIKEELLQDQRTSKMCVC